MGTRARATERFPARGLYRAAGLCGAVIFAAVGLVFLLFPDASIAFCNDISRNMGMLPLPEQGYGFYLILAVGYMYLAALLAFLMYRHPENPLFPLLLAHGKLASSVLSFFLIAAHGEYFIYVLNGVLDGSIGAAALFLYFRVRRNSI